MQAVDARELEDLTRTLQRMLKEFPEERRKLHEELAALAKGEVDAAISSADLNDASGHVRGWQRSHVGDRGGYAAVRPIGGKEGAQTGPNGPGAKTNYLEGGHNIASPRGGKHYRSRIKVSRVQGRFFYKTAGTRFKALAIQRTEQFAQQLTAKLEAGG